MSLLTDAAGPGFGNAMNTNFTAEVYDGGIYGTAEGSPITVNTTISTTRNHDNDFYNFTVSGLTAADSGKTIVISGSNPTGSFETLNGIAFSVPDPSTYALMLLGLGGFLVSRFVETMAEVDKTGFRDQESPVVNTGVTITGNAYSNETFGSDDGNYAANGKAYVGPNFTFTAVTAPEPSTYALMLAGLGMLALIAIPRRKAQSEPKLILATASSVFRERQFYSG